LRVSRCPNSESLSPEAVNGFLHFCVTGTISSSLLKSHFIEFLSLAKQWQVPELRAALEALGASESQDLRLLRAALLSNADTSLCESLVRANFRTHLTNGDLLGLPLRVLAPVIDLAQCGPADVDCIFEFLLSCLDRFGMSASCLFSGFDAPLLSIDQFKRLESRRDFHWCFLWNSIRQRLSDLFTELSLTWTRLEQVEWRCEERALKIERRFE
jgi:hypothetical protein